MNKYLIVYCVHWSNGTHFYNEEYEAVSVGDVYAYFYTKNKMGKPQENPVALINIIKIN